MAKPKKIGRGGESGSPTNPPCMPSRKTSPSQKANATITTDLTLEWLSLISEATFSLTLLSIFMFICFSFHFWFVAFDLQFASVSKVCIYTFGCQKVLCHSCCYDPFNFVATSS